METPTFEQPINPININLPTIALLPNNAKALREHRKRHPSEFEKIIRHKTGLTRYYSEEPSTCVGQWVLSQFTPPDNQWVLFYPLERDDKTPSTATLQWYGLHTLSGQVQREHIGTLESVINEFAFECTISERVYIPSQAEGDGDSEHGLPLALPGLTLSPDKLGAAAAINLHYAHLQHLPKRYLTQSTRRWQRPALIGIVCLCLTGLGVWLTLVNTPAPSMPQQTTDPLAQWLIELTQTPLAATTLSASETLLSQVRLLPQGYSAQKLTLSNAALILQVNATNNAPNRHMLKVWRQRYAADDRQWDDSNNQLSLTAPLAPQDTQVSVLGHYPDTLYEQLRLLGSSSLILSQQPRVGQVESWSIEGEAIGASTALLGNMAYLTTNKPVFMRELTVTPHDKGTLDVKFTLLVLGITP
jgi:hypothetical protein